MKTFAISANQLFCASALGRTKNCNKYAGGIFSFNNEDSRKFCDCYPPTQLFRRAKHHVEGVNSVKVYIKASSVQ